MTDRTEPNTSTQLAQLTLPKVLAAEVLIEDDGLAGSRISHRAGMRQMVQRGADYLSGYAALSEWPRGQLEAAVEMTLRAALGEWEAHS